MPTILKSEEVQAFAHCGATPGCPGVEQQPVNALKEELGHTFIERGGDLGSVENSFVHLRFADETDVQCPHCGRDRELSEQARVQYTSSGYDPNYLLTEKYAEQLAKQRIAQEQTGNPAEAPVEVQEPDRVGELEAKFDRLMGAVENIADAVVALEERGKEPEA